MGSVGVLAGQLRLRDMTVIDIPKHHVTVISGPTGAGKSTLLKSLVKPQKWMTNRLYFNNTSKEKVVYVSQDCYLFPFLTVLKNINFGLKHISNNLISLAEVIEGCALSEVLDLYPGQLSGGEKQRAALAQALLAQPELLLLDEIMSSQDESMRVKLLIFLSSWRKYSKSTLIYVTHNAVEALFLAEYFIYCHLDGTVLSGDVDEINHLSKWHTIPVQFTFSSFQFKTIQKIPHSYMQKIDIREVTLWVSLNYSCFQDAQRILLKAEFMGLCCADSNTMINTYSAKVISLLPKGAYGLDSAYRLMQVLLSELNFLVKVTYFDLERLAIKVGSDITLQLQPVLEPVLCEKPFNGR